MNLDTTDPKALALGLAELFTRVATALETTATAETRLAEITTAMHGSAAEVRRLEARLEELRVARESSEADWVDYQAAHRQRLATLDAEYAATRATIAQHHSEWREEHAAAQQAQLDAATAETDAKIADTLRRIDEDQARAREATLGAEQAEKALSDLTQAITGRRAELARIQADALKLAGASGGA